MPKRRVRNSLVDHVVRELREMIISGKYLAGAFLPSQKSLAIEFEVGLSTIHEAMQVLTALGLIESHPGKGTWVLPGTIGAQLHPETLKARLTELNAQQLYEARSVIEVGLTKLAAQRATDQDIQRIWAAQHVLELDHDNEAFVKADLDYHLTVAQAGHNELLEQFYHVARELLAEAAGEMVKLPGVKEAAVLQQAAVAKAIELHQVRKAEKAALAHMQYITSLLKQLDF
jgi:GntR family transcriptional repressor for pyruvate dehydrogenase complex